MNLRRVWHFIWKEDSLASWIVNVVLAFVLVKFVIYPGLGLLLNTSYPVVAVVSCSMEHVNPEKPMYDNQCSLYHLGFEKWWEINKEWYEKRGINKEDFERFLLRNGFNKGDIIVLYGTKFKELKEGDVVVYSNNKYRYPIIHRIVEKEDYFRTKGDNNNEEDPENIAEERYLGKAYVRVPLLGWVKILFTYMLDFLTGKF